MNPITPDPLQPHNPMPPTPTPMTPPTPVTPAAPAAVPPAPMQTPVADPAQSAGFVRPINVQPIAQAKPMTPPQPVVAPVNPANEMPYNHQPVFMAPPTKKTPLAMIAALIALLVLGIIGGLYVYGAYVHSQQLAEQPQQGFQVTERQIDTPNFDGYESQNSYNGVDQILDQSSQPSVDSAPNPLTTPTE